MERKTAHDFDQDLLILFDAYVHGGIDRRAFLDQAAKFAVGGVTAAMLLEQLSPKFLEAQVVPKTDPRIVAEYVEYDSPNGYGKARGYLVRPAKATGTYSGDPSPATEEVEKWQWISPDELRDWIGRDPSAFTVWFERALYVSMLGTMRSSTFAEERTPGTPPPGWVPAPTK